MTVMSAWTARLKYDWKNSSNPAVLLGHRLADTRIGPQRPALTSYFPERGMRILSTGKRDGLPQVLSLLEQFAEPILGPSSGRSESRVTLTELVRDQTAADLVVVGCRHDAAMSLPARASIVVPHRAHLVLDIEGDVDYMRARVAKGARQEFDRSRRAHHWRLVQGHTDADFALFYDRMHAPTMASRHGERTRSERREVAYEALFRRGMLFFVESDGQPVSGALCHWDPSDQRLTMRLLGVLGADPELYRRGALKAVYHCLMEWSCENGVRHFDFGGTEGFLSRGIVQWKRRFHPRIEPAPTYLNDKRLWVHAVRDTDAVRDFLVANPAITHAADGALEAVWFYDEQREARTSIGCGIVGVARERHVHLDEFLYGAAVTRGALESNARV